MDIKEKLGSTVRTIGWEIWVAVIAVAIVAGSIAIQYSSAKVATGILSIGQGIMYTYFGVVGFRSDVIFAVFGVIITTFAALFSRLMHYIHRRSQVKPTVEEISVENLNKAALKIEETTAKFEKNLGEKWDALTAATELNTQEIQRLRSEQKTHFGSIEDQLEGKGLLEKAKDAVVSKLPGKSEEA